MGEKSTLLSIAEAGQEAADEEPVEEKAVAKEEEAVAEEEGK